MGSHRATRRALVGVLAAVAVSGLAGCTSTVDSVEPERYITPGGDGWYRVQTPYATPSVPAVVPFPESCKSPPSMMGLPENC